MTFSKLVKGTTKSLYLFGMKVYIRKGGLSSASVDLEWAPKIRTRTVTGLLSLTMQRKCYMCVPLFLSRFLSRHMQCAIISFVRLATCVVAKGIVMRRK